MRRPSYVLVAILMFAIGLLTGPIARPAAACNLGYSNGGPFMFGDCDYDESCLPSNVVQCEMDWFCVVVRD